MTNENQDSAPMLETQGDQHPMNRAQRPLDAAGAAGAAGVARDPAGSERAAAHGCSTPQF